MAWGWVRSLFKGRSSWYATALPSASLSRVWCNEYIDVMGGATHPLCGAIHTSTPAHLLAFFRMMV